MTASAAPVGGRNASAEPVEEVDADGRVLRVVSRGEMRTRNLRHRVVYVVVRTPTDEVVVHRRAEWKDLFGGFWDLAFGGVAGVAESYDAVAVRELAEEAGVLLTLVDRGAVRYEDRSTNVVGRVYDAVGEGPFVCDDGEVVEIDLVPRHALADWAARRRVCTDSLLAVLPAVRMWPPP